MPGGVLRAAGGLPVLRGGGGAKCVEMVEAYERKRQKRKAIRDNDGAK